MAIEKRHYSLRHLRFKTISSAFSHAGPYLSLKVAVLKRWYRRPIRAKIVGSWSLIANNASDLDGCKLSKKGVEVPLGKAAS